MTVITIKQGRRIETIDIDKGTLEVVIRYANGDSIEALFERRESRELYDYLGERIGDGFRDEINRDYEEYGSCISTKLQDNNMVIGVEIE